MYFSMQKNDFIETLEPHQLNRLIEGYFTFEVKLILTPMSELTRVGNKVYQELNQGFADRKIVLKGLTQ